MSFDGRAASSSGCAIRPRGHETGSTGYIGRTPSSSPTGHYVMATAEHREPCELRGSCTVLGAPGGETPSGDSPIAPFWPSDHHVRSTLNNGRFHTWSALHISAQNRTSPILFSISVNGCRGAEVARLDGRPFWRRCRGYSRLIGRDANGRLVRLKSRGHGPSSRRSRATVAGTSFFWFQWGLT